MSAASTIAPMSGVIYCGDNLEILREPDYIPSGSVDLIYLDPPFNSQRTYNLIYKGSKAQEEAFKDYWSWSESAGTYAELVERGRAPLRLRALLKSLHGLLIDEDSDLLAYLVMMAARLVELHRVLKPTGSMYLHCDPTASHYLKVILDAILGPGSFANEITWLRTNARTAPNRWPRLHDVLLFFSKGETRTFHPLLVPADRGKLPHTLITGPDGAKYQTFELTAPNLRFGETGKAWRGFQPAKMGRCWANPPAVMEAWDAQGLIHWPKKKGAWPRRRAVEPFEPDQRLVTVGDVWQDLDRINQSAKERMGYPTQKPVALLERIIQASSNPGDLVLDAFCGCGTNAEASERLGRRWIGIDIARKAVEVIEERFRRVGLDAPKVIWHPADAEGAEALAERDPKQFEAWANRRLGSKKGRKDRGIDGEATYQAPDGTLCRALVSVKGGKTLNPAMVRELRGTIEREGAPIGVLFTMHEPSKEMRLEAARAMHTSFSDLHGPIPRIQILTVAELFAGGRIRAPGLNVTPASSIADATPQLSLPGIRKTPIPPAKTKPRAAKKKTA